MHLLGAPPFAFTMPAYGPPQAIDLLTGTLVACGVIVVGLAALAVFPFVYRALHALRYPIVVATVGGLVLGVLGFIGGPITMFKGLEQMGELLKDPTQYDAGQLAAIAGIKIVALLVAASALFRGGRVFPSAFIGVALGLMVSALFPSLPISLVVACAVMGMMLVVARDGWLALFIAVAVPGDISLLPVLCIVVLPAWLLVSRAPEFRIVPLVAAPPADSARAA
jgi:H+/Cl- antiporter ClcA